MASGTVFALRSSASSCPQPSLQFVVLNWWVWGFVATWETTKPPNHGLHELPSHQLTGSTKNATRGHWLLTSRSYSRLLIQARQWYRAFCERGWTSNTSTPRSGTRRHNQKPGRCSWSWMRWYLHLPWPPCAFAVPRAFNGPCQGIGSINHEGASWMPSRAKNLVGVWPRVWGQAPRVQRHLRPRSASWFSIGAAWVMQGYDVSAPGPKRLQSFGCGSKLNHQGPQVLVHVSFYQGSISDTLF